MRCSVETVSTENDHRRSSLPTRLRQRRFAATSMAPTTTIAATSSKKKAVKKAAPKRKAPAKRKAAEESNDLLVQELNHRIKNLFSVTNALIGLSARYATTVDDFAEATRRRLFALHEAHNVGTADLKHRKANLKDILETTLRPWRTTPQRIFVNGSDHLFDAGAATAWALIVHELASNAVKHGALKDSGGRLEIDWEDGEDAFIFRWREESSDIAPSDNEQESAGFGQTIVNRLVSGFLAGEISRNAAPGEIMITIEMPKETEE